MGKNWSKRISYRKMKKIDDDQAICIIWFMTGVSAMLLLFCILLMFNKINVVI